MCVTCIVCVFVYLSVSLSASVCLLAFVCVCVCVCVCMSVCMQTAIHILSEHKKSMCTCDLCEAMERSLRECYRSILIGKILIRHNPDTSEAKLYYAKFPSDIDKMNILLLFPNLGEFTILPSEYPIKNFNSQSCFVHSIIPMLCT